jgi:adenosine/AMP kinase
MPAEAIFTLVVAALIIAAAALGLLRVIFHLRAVSQTLGALDGGVKVIVAQTSTVAPVVGSVNGSLAPVRAFAESI